MRFRWRQCLHDVTRAEGPERIAMEWWRKPGPTRDYFRIETEAGQARIAHFTLFRQVNEAIQGADIRAEVVIMQKSISFMANIYKCGIERRQHFPDATHVNVAYKELFRYILMMQLGKPSVFQQGYIGAGAGSLND